MGNNIALSTLSNISSINIGNNNIILTNIHIIDSKMVLDKGYYSVYIYDTNISNYTYMGNITNNNILGVIK